MWDRARRPRSQAAFTLRRQCCGTARWVFLNKRPLRRALVLLAGAIAESESFSLAGGGDTLAAIDQFGVADNISYISTGGGAFLEYVEGKVLPAVAVLFERAQD